jgi:hypothetical protein
VLVHGRGVQSDLSSPPNRGVQWAWPRYAWLAGHRRRFQPTLREGAAEEQTRSCARQSARSAAEARTTTQDPGRRVARSRWTGVLDCALRDLARFGAFSPVTPGTLWSAVRGLHGLDGIAALGRSGSPVLGHREWLPALGPHHGKRVSHSLLSSCACRASRSNLGNRSSDSSASGSVRS